MINIKLIESCYCNEFRIDLKAFHKKQFENCEAELSPEVLIRHILFDDYISKSFQLVIYDELIYLMGDKSCYPCSPLVRSVYGIHWVPIILLPNGNSIKTENNIKNSAVLYINDFTNLLDEISDECILKYLDRFTNSFSQNNWFSMAFCRNVISSRNFSFSFIYNYIRANNLLTMFELSLISILNSEDLNYKDLLHSLNFDNLPRKSFSYISFLGKEFKLSKSLKEIIDSDEFSNLLKTLNHNELNDFFEVDFIRNHVCIEKVNDQNILDIFQINVFKRYYSPCNPNYVNDMYIKMKDTLATLNITKDLLGEFNNRILKNIRSLENSIRKNKGYPEVGGLYRELIVYNFFKNHLPNYTVVKQYSPKWLDRQRFDVFISEINVAVEYNGKQHYEAIDFFGGENGLKQNIKRDKIKEEKCLLNDCKLYVIRYDENLNNRLEQILLEIIAN